MASAPVMFLLLVVLSVVVRAQQNDYNLITLGSSLSPNSNTSWLSPSGLFAFGFYPQGNEFAVGIWLVGHENTIVWTAYRDDPPVSSNAMLDLTRDGKLRLRTGKGEEKLIAQVSDPAVSASMLDSGNFVLYNYSSVIWESFDFPTDTILEGQNLSSGNQLVSSMSRSDHSSGRLSLSMQRDGNLVAYPVNSSSDPEDSYWSSGTNGAGVGVQLTLNHSGLLCLSNRGLNIYTLANSSYSSKNKTSIYRATLDADGIFRLYLHHFESNTISDPSVEWWSLHNQCEVKGFCGFNSYCSGLGNEAYCNCFPGFVFIDPSKKFLGCYRNFSEVGCRGGKKDPLMLYKIMTLENMELGDHPYSVVSMKKADCGESCLEDCNCGVALYVISGNCNKFKLPLRYGRSRTPNESSATGFFQVGWVRSEIVVLDSKRSLILILAISLGSIACLCCVVAISSFFLYRHRVHMYRKLSENANLGLTGEFTLRSFSYNELEKATDGFKEELGRGSYGAVYKGTVSGGTKVVAVKRLEKVLEEGQKEFRAEMTAIGRTHHRNLVRLLGFCVEGSKRLLVYEYMSNGSLADFLFIKAERRPNWRERMTIVLDVARGILYLHDECETHIIHCDIKPQNILMDDSWTAKISDFGLAKLLMPNQTGTITGIRGTTGYSAPEWHKHALITVKADIYSFGVLLLEIICCRSNIEVDVSTADEIILCNWVYDCFVARQLDKLVGDEFVDIKMLERVVKVGLWCIQDDPGLRPSMKNVILMLEGTMDIPVPPSPSPSPTPTPPL